MERLSCPISVQIELTEACNQKCQHCYNYWRYDSNKIKDDELDENKFIEIIDKLNFHGISLLTLTGGEPLLRPEILFSMLNRAKKYDMEVGVNSNAVLITKEIAQTLKKERLDHTLISLMGTEDTHNAISNLPNGFVKTCSGISHLISAGVDVTVNMVVSKLNYGEIYDVGLIIKKLGVRNFCVTPMVPSHESHLKYLLSGLECKNSLLELLKTKNDFGFNIDTLEPIARCLFSETEDDTFVNFFGNRICSAAVSSCAISSRGKVRPCIHSDQQYGNILKDNLLDIWQNMNYWSSKEILPDECISCNANIVCEDGCRMSAKHVNGAYNAKDMYMTEPIMDFSRINKLPKRNNISFTDETPLRINEHIKFRQERFGWVVYVYSNLEFCTESGFEFINKLRSKESFTINSLSSELMISNVEIKPVISKLVNNKIISTL